MFNGFGLVFLIIGFFLHSSAWAGNKNINDPAKWVKNNIIFYKFDLISKRKDELCPGWVQNEVVGAICNRVDVVYRGVYLSGLLVQTGDQSDSLTIYHVGHESSGNNLERPSSVTQDVIAPDAAWLTNQFLNSQSDVLILFMPGMGFSPEPEKFSEPVVRLNSMLGQHSVFSMLDFYGDSAATYFIAHVKGFLDKYGEKYRKVTMVGRSGGGWVTTLAAAVDTRVQCSVSIFGSLPMKLRLPVEGDLRNDMGDFEQHGLLIFKEIDYIDLYALATTRQRRHSLILNSDDECCFSGRVKGPVMWDMFQEKYPSVRGFSWVNLPSRGDRPHYSMGAMVKAAIEKVCPVGRMSVHLN